MTRNILSVVTLSACLIATTAVAQVETKPVLLRNQMAGYVEEFNVLKTGRSVRQGPYARYQQNAFVGTIIFESGQYEQGQKEGEWLVFSEHRPWNKLISRGTYHAGQPDGWWTYYQILTPGPTTVAQAVANGADPKAGYSINIADTTAVLQARGQYAQGKRIGIWNYYNRQGQVLQIVDHFANQLLYQRKADGSELNGTAVATHPVLYVGGKEQLEVEIHTGISKAIVAIMSAGKDNESEFVFMVDAAGQLTGVALAGGATPTRYEKVLLTILTKIPARWLPSSTDGKLQSGEYRVKIITQAEAMNQHPVIRTEVKALGD